MSTEEKKKILVTGATQGIGLALVKRLVTEKDCFVYLGARDVSRGEAAKDALLRQVDDDSSSGINPNKEKADEAIRVLELDVTRQDTIDAAAGTLRGVTLYALVNNAGVGLNAPGDILDVNYEGIKRVTDAFVDRIDPAVGRIVNVSSGAASMWLRNRDAETKRVFSAPASVEELDAAVARSASRVDDDGMGMYGLSKAANTALTVLHAGRYPHLTITSLSPGYVETRMTGRYAGNKLTPEQGCRSLLKCLFDENVVSGAYYGSDGLRSPLTCTRDPGTPEYQGEANPDPAKYNK